MKIKGIAKMQRRAGVIKLNPELLLTMLGFKGGKVLGVREGPPWLHCRIEIAIEHKDMPIIKEGKILQDVYPSYYRCKNGRVRRIKEKYTGGIETAYVQYENGHRSDSPI